ncbi:uncharacterized protein E0L32_009785 [Thyridium curvatum]|uniref:ER membrane protein complex subunit 2 n=1 Tax=Thyridium curvatum TaxID=1093900 RepID=A0A507AM66_9PEZI|nr:uncharacterized protein E0L32_009785 [Thyridium curvatum]TPX08723.1 hypothetical protein E0L32_009785 [Thyridium curvatum]
MAPSLFQPPSHLSPAEALQLSQQAPSVLKSSPSSISSSPFVSLFSAPESGELWVKYENLLLSCLRTGDETSAHACLERLANRFGDDNEKIMGLKGLLKEAAAENPSQLEKVLQEYDAILKENDTNIPITKRRIALLRSLGRTADAVTACIALLDFSPTDAEAWSELSDLYFSQGMYAQAIYALEEVLVLTPNAWNIHARLGELEYMAATAPGATENGTLRYLVEAMKRFSRSIELCDDYLRGYYGLKLVTSRLLKEPSKSARQLDADDFAVPDTATIQRLSELATKKLSEIVRRNTAQEPRWRGYEQSEVSAARELLARETADVVR